MKLDKDLLGITFLIFILAVAWIYVESYYSYKKATYTGIDASISTSIDPNINFEGTGL